MSAADVRQEERTGDEGAGTKRRTKRAVVNWVLALLTIPGAGAVVLYSYVQVLGTAACTGGGCGHMGPSESVFGLIMYGTPFVAVAAIALSFFTARRARGFVVPAIAWTLLVVAFVILAVTFRR
jgi:hypothetical protein